MCPVFLRRDNLFKGCAFSDGPQLFNLSGGQIPNLHIFGAKKKKIGLIRKVIFRSPSSSLPISYHVIRYLFTIISRFSQKTSFQE